MQHLAILVVAALSAAGCESSKAEAPSATHQAPSTNSPAPAPSAAERHRVTVTVTGSGYEPGSISAHAGRWSSSGPPTKAAASRSSFPTATSAAIFRSTRTSRSS